MELINIFYFFLGIIPSLILSYIYIQKNHVKYSEIKERNKFLDESLIEKHNYLCEFEEKNANQALQINELSKKLAIAETKNQNQETLKENLAKEFKLITSQIIENSEEKLAHKNSKLLDNIISPFKDKVGDLEKKINQCYDQELRDKISLKQEIKNLYQLNSQLNLEAKNLTKALKGDNKMQGNWGEMILESILEKSGLHKGSEYEIQESSENINGQKIQPDIVIYLPENKHIIIDAKISLKSYEEYVNANEEKHKEIMLKNHLLSIANHIEGLAKKNYHSSKKHNSLDFILMFLPIEPAYLVAMQHDTDLFWRALDKKILIVSPTTLHSTLKIIEALWRQEKQSKNAKEIALLSGALYDKFVNFSEEMLKIGRAIKTAENSYNESINKLSRGKGNIIRKLEDIRNLGAKTSKNISEHLIEEDIDKLSA
jgi:DNA recombination protein RmuC